MKGLASETAAPKTVMITAAAYHAAPDESSARRAIAQPAPLGVNDESDSGHGWMKDQWQVTGRRPGQ